MIKISIRKKLHMAAGEATLAVDTELQPQSFNTLYGPSGAGKLRCLKYWRAWYNPIKVSLK
jgi:ABC-type ATPase involved in cell division